MRMDEQLAELILEYARPECPFLPIFYAVKIEVDCTRRNEEMMTEDALSLQVLEVFQ
jgi:hypothetical protein